MQSHIINISVLDGRPVDCKISKGEIIYLLKSSKAASFLDLLIDLKFPLDNNDHILGYELSSLDTSERIQLRRSIGLINESPLLWQADQTIENNFKYYSDAVDLNYAKSSVRFESLRKSFGLERGLKIVDLDIVQRFIYEIVINLAKAPQVLIIDNPLFFSNQGQYQELMSYLYEEVLNQGLTFLAVVPDPSAVEDFPGRFISL